MGGGKRRLEPTRRVSGRNRGTGGEGGSTWEGTLLYFKGSVHDPQTKTSTEQMEPDPSPLVSFPERNSPNSVEDGDPQSQDPRVT